MYEEHFQWNLYGLSLDTVYLPFISKGSVEMSTLNNINQRRIHRVPSSKLEGSHFGCQPVFMSVVCFVLP